MSVWANTVSEVSPQQMFTYMFFFTTFHMHSTCWGGWKPYFLSSLFSPTFSTEASEQEMYNNLHIHSPVFDC